MKKLLKISVRVFVLLFAAIGLLLTGGFFAVKWGLTNVSGAIDLNDRVFYEGNKIVDQPTKGARLPVSADDICKLSVIANAYPKSAASIFEAISLSSAPETISLMS